MKNVSMIITVAIALVGCSTHLRPVGAPVSRSVQAAPPQIASAVLGALERLRYQVEYHTPPTVVASYARGGQQLRVRIDYGAGGYRIGLVDSAGMGQGVDPRTGQQVISSRYHRHLQKLEVLVGRMLRSEAATPDSGEPLNEERTIALSRPTQLGVIERALVLGGFDIETRRDDAGFITTQFVDSGDRYGSVDGDDATIHQRVTVVLSEHEMRIRMDLRRCATGGVFLSSALGAAAITGRCEAMDLPADRGLRGRVRRSLLETVERVEGLIRREVESAPAPAAPGESVFQDV